MAALTQHQLFLHGPLPSLSQELTLEWGTSRGDLGTQPLWLMKRQEGRKEKRNHPPGYHHLHPCLLLLLQFHAHQNGVCSINTSSPHSAARQCNPKSQPFGCVLEGTHLWITYGIHPPVCPVPSASPVSPSTALPASTTAALKLVLKHQFLLLANVPALLFYKETSWHGVCGMKLLPKPQGSQVGLSTQH